MSAPLRIGLLVDSLVLPAWNHEVLDVLEAASWAEISLVVRRRNDTVSATPMQRARSRVEHLAYALYTKVDDRLHERACQPIAFESVAADNRLADVPIADVAPRTTRFSDYLEDHDLEKIRDASIDVLLRWGFRILRGKVLGVAKYGIWSFHHADSRTHRGSMPAFWEVMDGIPTTGSTLQVLSEQLDAGTVIERYAGATEATSVALNKHMLYWKSAPMLTRNLERLAADREVFMERLGSEQETKPYCQPLRLQPTNREVVAGVAKLVGRVARAKAQHLLRYDQWFLAYRVRKRNDDPNLAFYQYEHIQPPRHLFWADPFVVQRDDRYWIFFEEFVFARERAHISVLEVDAKGKWSNPRPVIEQPYHMSYPHTFEYAGELWMIPETAQNRSIELYRCRAFPDRWEKETVLMDDLNAVDTTLHHHDGRWWMFVCIAEKNLRNRDTLYLFHAETPLGPWTPHPENPIKRDVRSARPAGELFEHDGRMIRPAQDCAGRYGAAITINEVMRLDESHYRERFESRITPDWDPKIVGTHTVNRAGDLTVIDGEALRSRLR